jgi:hypothetical protein
MTAPWVIGPSGYPLYKHDLPSPRARWTPLRKAEVIAAINGGLLSIDEACTRYGLTLEELATWQRTVERAGIPGLRATRAQHHRDAQEKAQRFGWAA